MKKYEYKFQSICREINQNQTIFSGSISVLKDLGNQGWELISSIKEDTGDLTCLFKREVTNEIK